VALGFSPVSPMLAAALICTLIIAASVLALFYGLFWHHQPAKPCRRRHA